MANKIPSGNMVEAKLAHLERAERIMFAGDWHGDAEWAKECLLFAAKNDVSIVIQLGDFGVWPGPRGKDYLTQVSFLSQKHRIPIFFIDGNHEDFDQLLAYRLSDEGLRPIKPGLTHLPRTFRWMCQGLSFVALGGATSLDRGMRVEKVSWWPEEEIAERDNWMVIEAGHADVMLTHDCPTGTEIPGIKHRDPNQGWPVVELERAWGHRDRLRATFDAVSPSYLFHGHFHVAYTYDLEGCQVAGLGDNGLHSLKESTVIWDLTDRWPDV